MVENSEQIQKKTAAEHWLAFKRLMIKLLVLAVLAAAGYGLWKNPQIVDQIKAVFSGRPSVEDTIAQDKITLFESRLDGLQNQLRQIENQPQAQNVADLSELSQRLDNLEKTNLNVINSKADVATVLGIITRMDKAEQRLDHLGKVSDNSALILTAVMLVRDSAENGGGFEYEAEVLKQLAAEESEMGAAVEQIYRASQQGILKETQLNREFGVIYKKLLKAQKDAYEQTWTDRINSKLSEIVQIKRVNGEHPKFEADEGLEKIRQDVETGNYAAALRELNKPSNAALKEDTALAAWAQEVQARVNFYEAVQQIAARSLAVMKVNFLKQTRTNN